MKRMEVLALGAAVAFSLGAQDVRENGFVRLDIRNNNGFEHVTARNEPLDWTYNSYSRTFKGGGTMKTVDGGRTGKALSVRTGPGQAVFFHSAAAVPVKPGRDTFAASIYTRGKGTIQFQLYGYDASRRNCGGWNSVRVHVDSKDWRKQEFRIVLTPQPKTASIRMAPCVYENSDLLLDDLTAFIERKAK